MLHSFEDEALEDLGRKAIALLREYGYKGFTPEWDKKRRNLIIEHDKISQK